MNGVILIESELNILTFLSRHPLNNYTVPGTKVSKSGTT